MTNEFFNIDNSTSYATEANLEKALKKYGFENDRHLVVCNRQGRFTAIFPASNVMAPNAPADRAGDLTRYSRRGFMLLG